MNPVILKLPNSAEEIEVIVTKKKMKNVRLKVFPDRKVALSSPQNVPNAWIEEYLKEKSGWIEERLTYFRKTTGYEAIKIIKSGISTKILGREVIILVEESPRKKVYRDEDRVIVGIHDKSNYEDIIKQFDRWWKIQAKLYYENVLQRLYPILGKYIINRPSLTVRKMKTLWGSCSVGKDKITINQYLYKALPPCIEYVILHELTHLLYPKHNRQFYDFLSIHMPDWKERKRILDHEVVQGL